MGTVLFSSGIKSLHIAHIPFISQGVSHLQLIFPILCDLDWNRTSVYKNILPSCRLYQFIPPSPLRPSMDSNQKLKVALPYVLSNYTIGAYYFCSDSSVISILDRSSAQSIHRYTLCGCFEVTLTQCPRYRNFMCLSDILSDRFSSSA
jgi:hypothetical protein